MKASDLIAVLQAMIAEHGDREVYAPVDFGYEKVYDVHLNHAENLRALPSGVFYFSTEIDSGDGL